MWRKAAENLANLARKGALLAVTGRIQTRNYENQQGQRVYVTEVIAENFQLLEKKAEGTSRDAGGTQNSFEGNYTPRTQNSSQGNLGVNPMDRHENNFSGSSVDISDDDLPF
jgi:single stranded DNA-binding protein (ssb)